MSKEKVSSILFWCLFFIYIVNIVGKTSFSAATVALIDENVLTKTQVGLISGAFWLLYAIGQFFGGFVADKTNPYILIQSTIISSMLANFLLAFENRFIFMFIIWGLNGILQFGFWPALLKIVSTQILPAQRASAMAKLGFCFCLGSIVSYVLTAVFLMCGVYQSIFISCGAVTAVSLLISLYMQRKLSPILHNDEIVTTSNIAKKGKFTWKIVWESGLMFFCLLILIRNFVDSGIKNWMPVIIMETYGASPSFSTILSVLLLVTNILGVLVCTHVYGKTRYDELRTLQTIYILVLPMMLLLLGFEYMNMYVTTIILSGVTLLVYGSGQIMMINYPNRFAQYSLVATVGGIINSFAAFGNVIASYVSGYVAEHYGWSGTIYVWNILIVLFIVVAISISPIWKKFRG